MYNKSLILKICCLLLLFSPFVQRALAGGSWSSGYLTYWFTKSSSSNYGRACYVISSGTVYYFWGCSNSYLNDADYESLSFKYSYYNSKTVEEFRDLLSSNTDLATSFKIYASEQDSDGDGVSDYWEISQSDGDFTDAEVQPAESEPVELTDTNSNGIPDRLESRLGDDLSTENILANLKNGEDGEFAALWELFAGRDYDGDGKSDLTEIIMGSDYLDSEDTFSASSLSDFDNDGYYDYIEILAGTAPDDCTSVPSDRNNDGVIDFIADNFSADTDGDGDPDLIELMAGSDPDDSSSNLGDSWYENYVDLGYDAVLLPNISDWQNVEGGDYTPSTPSSGGDDSDGSGSGGTYNNSSGSSSSGDAATIELEVTDYAGEDAEEQYTAAESETPANGSNQDLSDIRTILLDTLYNTDDNFNNSYSTNLPSVGNLSNWSAPSRISATTDWDSTVTADKETGISYLEGLSLGFDPEENSDSPPMWSFTFPISKLNLQFLGGDSFSASDITVDVDFSWFNDSLRRPLHIAIIAIWTFYMAQHVLEEMRRY